MKPSRRAAYEISTPCWRTHREWLEKCALPRVMLKSGVFWHVPTDPPLSGLRVGTVKRWCVSGAGSEGYVLPHPAQPIL